MLLDPDVDGFERYKSEELLILFNNFNRAGHMDFRAFMKPGPQWEASGARKPRQYPPAPNNIQIWIVEVVWGNVSIEGLLVGQWSVKWQMSAKSNPSLGLSLVFGVYKNVWGLSLVSVVWSVLGFSAKDDAGHRHPENGGTSLAG